MKKLQMAHEYAMKHVQEGFAINYDVLVVEAWKYADAMQAEADKRKPIPKLPALQQTFIDGVEQPGEATVKIGMYSPGGPCTIPPNP